MVDIRTATVTMPLLVVDLVAAVLAPHATLDVVVRLADRAAIEHALAAAAPTLILVGLLPSEDDGIATTLRALVPHAKVVALSSNGRTAHVHEAGRTRTTLHDFSPRQLRDAILDRPAATEV